MLLFLSRCSHYVIDLGQATLSIQIFYRVIRERPREVLDHHPLDRVDILGYSGVAQVEDSHEVAE